MVNREMTNRFPAKDNVPGDVLMEVSHLTGKYMPTCQDVSFELRAGEVLGVAGLVGSRRTELLSTIFGIMARESGEIKLNGKPISNKTPRQSIKNGFAMLTEERRATGVFGCLSVLDNTVIASQKNYANHGVLNQKKRYQAAYDADKQLNVKTPSLEALMQNLSGGNQQKVLIARWLLTEPDILILDEPTNGLDPVGIQELRALVRSFPEHGITVVLSSHILNEGGHMADLVGIIVEGRLAYEAPLGEGVDLERLFMDVCLGKAVA